MADMKLPTRSEDFSEWYNQLVLRAELADESRGCVEIALLIVGHESIDMVVRSHAVDRLSAILIDSSRFAQAASRNPSLACGPV